MQQSVSNMFTSRETKKIQSALQLHKKALEKNSDIKQALYEDYKDGILNREEFIAYGKVFTSKIEREQEAMAVLAEKLKGLEMCASNNNASGLFDAQEQLKIPQRHLVVSCISRIRVFEGKRIEITLSFSDSFAELIENGQ